MPPKAGSGAMRVGTTDREGREVRDRPSPVLPRILSPSRTPRRVWGAVRGEECALDTLLRGRFGGLVSFLGLAQSQGVGAGARPGELGGRLVLQGTVRPLVVVLPP